MNKLIAWVEIPALNFDRAVNFYSKVFEIDFEIIDSGTEKMACFPSGEGAISKASGFNPSKDGVLVSLNTGDNLDQTILRVEESLCQIKIPKTKIEAAGRGYFATFIDSEGNTIGLYGN